MSTVPDKLLSLCCGPYPGGVEPAVAAGMTARELAVEGGALRYWASASPDPGRGWMVLLPGLSADHTLFNPQFAHFAMRWNLVVWDAPGHGLSRPWGRPLSIDGMAQTLHTVLGACGVRRPILVGQSLGGYVAQALIDRYPGSARAFVSIDSSPMQRRYYKGWHLGVLRHMEGLCLLWGTERFLRGQIAGNCSTTEHGRLNMLQQLARYSKRELCALYGGGFRAIADAVAQNRPYRIDCPLMIVCGTRDAAGFVKAYDEEWSSETGVPITWVEGAGHNSNVDDPAFVNAAVDAFLNAVT
ncbi:alpha/beta hydrolase [Actinomyces sp. MRS3W]|uniref:alpha/beta fold hydrolase n=1 Tax=Actinomyces sp. MRS3W TaxID=2800796 RepID=UPI0028FD83B8|nr:alpha/beta hydrolase [Actinomyces sp. MRS3W]MDU0348205.1 alpha/beta hydrolase [Actinomyces sp. MRS3W]